MSGVIRWEDPPSIRHIPVRRPIKNADWPSIAADLVARPGEWALVRICRSPALAASTALNVRKGLYDVLTPFQPIVAVARTVDGEPRIYARYVGGAGSEATPKDSSDLGGSV